jgi:purine nucleosidase
MTATPPIAPRARLIIDNDFGGDPDGLFQLAHHLLSPSVNVRAIIGSQHYTGGFYGLPGTSMYACELARDLLKIIRPTADVPVLEASLSSLRDTNTPDPTEAAEFIVREAMRTDTNLPLYVACGAGLTSIASAYLLAPEISRRLTLVWIGGPEHEGQAIPPPLSTRIEYNLGIDLHAAQAIFNHSDIPLWQVPRNAYRQALTSYAELLRHVQPHGALGEFLVGKLQELMTRANHTLGEAYVLGDSPLVLLTALQSSWEADPSSSDCVVIPAPNITNEGQYEANPNGRPIRVYTRLDVRLMLADFYAKIAQFGHTPRAA